MSRDVLNDIIANFETEKFINFFRSKTPDFAPSQERLPRYDDSDFANFKKLGEIGFLNSEQRLIIVSAKVTKNLSERSGKKAQYEKAKKILRELDRYEIGIFIFHDKTGSFRFSLVYEQTLGPRRTFSNFRRFTYFVDISQTNKTFLKQIGDGDFSSLEKIKERFSVEKVTKDFYREISNWYFWAIKNVVFPEDAEKDRNKRNSFAVIRLITRIIFIWFMKEKGLMPAYLFNEKKVKDFLKDLSKNESSYYKAILQNLFFATLNTPINKRGFREQRNFQNKNKDFMNHHIYRYEKYFKDSDYILKLFKGIPFLNGGLFECLDKTIKKEDKNYHIRIDGFSDRKDNSLKAPNFLFFSEELEVDLNKDYGTKIKKYKTRGFINILKSYNFTIDENTPIDEEIALDPELLGRVFENLLASYNPETSTTARKATGSYYTPRMIVDYMVNESLKAYFKNRLAEVKDIDKKLTDLLSYSEENHKFNNSEVNILIEAINELKIIDPAVGSGAFPMGILQKLVFILSKLDPHNTKWKQEQIKAVEKNIPDDVLKRDLIEKIEANFKNNELDYGRKLYLIQNCVYGVDIQPIAIQICKLRFFISLLVDEKSNDDEKKNFGIEPLPNLETKFVSANSLIGLKKMGQLLLPVSDVIALEKEMSEIRRKHFTASRRKEKENLRKKDAEIREKLTKLLEGSIFSSETTAKLASWNPYNPNASADFFDPEWMFGVKGGFDIVIGNPPWVSNDNLKAKEKSVYQKIFTVAKSRFDLANLFVEKSITILRERGVLYFVMPEHVWLGDYFKPLREYLSHNVKILEILSSKEEGFEQTANPSSIFLIQKIPQDLPKQSLMLGTFNTRDQPNKFLIETNIVQRVIFDEFVQGLIKKIELFGFKTLGEIALVTDGIQTANLLKILFTQEPLNLERYHKALRSGKAIQFRYAPLWWDDWWILKPEYTRQYRRPGFSYDSPKRMRCFSAKEKIVLRQTEPTIFATIDIYGYFFPNSIFQIVLDPENPQKLRWLLGLLNSKFLRFFYSKLSQVEGTTKPQIYLNLLKSLPIPNKVEPTIIESVDKILTITKSSDYLQNQSKQAKVKEYEKQIDQMVYKLYNLTPEEIEIVEANKKGS